MNARWQAVSQLHENERLITLAQEWTGKLAVWVLAAILLHPFAHTGAVLPALVLTTLWPSGRRLLLSAAALYVVADLVVRRSEGGVDSAGAVAQLVAFVVLLALAILLFRAARSLGSLPATVRRHPVLWLHLAFWCLAAALWATPVGSWPWSVQLVVWGLLPILLWRASFLCLTARRGKAEDTDLRDHLFYLWPAFGGTDVPIGKGLDTLDRHEARDGKALARSQLAGLKCLLLACLWLVVSRTMESVVHGVRSDPLREFLGGFSLHVPHLESMLRGDVTPSVPMGWLALYVELMRVTLAIAVIGHVVVGSLRLLGFNVFRNTYKPLLAESIVDFWNRFYYYFKELLVELWFYPTYLSSFRKHPRLRTCAAVFAAAGLGNLYYHVIRDRDLVARADLDALVHLHAPRAFYCLLLAAGISVSMLRQQALRGKPRSPEAASPLRRVWRMAGVWTFFAVIHVWAVTVPESDLGGRFAFVLHLIGLGEVSATP